MKKLSNQKDLNDIHPCFRTGPLAHMTEVPQYNISSMEVSGGGGGGMMGTISDLVERHISCPDTLSTSKAK